MECDSLVLALTPVERRSLAIISAGADYLCRLTIVKSYT
jgi:hypothetical protein